MIVRLGDSVDGLAIDTDAGGRLASLVLAGHERLLTEPASPAVDPILGWGCFLMAPFVGRILEARVDWRGRAEILPRNHGRHAIHGAVFDVPWTVNRASANEAVLECELDRARWPFCGRMTQRIAIGPGRLELEAEVLADEPMPVAMGWHPWFRRAGGVCVAVASDAVLRLTDELIPTGQLEPVDSRTDLRVESAIDDRTLDDVYTSVRPPVVVAWPDLELTMDFADPIATVVVYVDPGAVCVEPMTAWPDAIRLAEGDTDGTGLACLEAGERLLARTVWTWKHR